ncbi:MAG: hypothetical protein O2973_00820 [Gemmatimonadetes bacterium]|nr:hypothetical protein [Gemmatimonadota bacterium]
MTVTDSGAGIAPEHLGYIFNPFHTTKPRGGRNRSRSLHQLWHRARARRLDSGRVVARARCDISCSPPHSRRKNARRAR